MTRLTAPLLILAALATFYASASFLTGFDDDFLRGAVVTVVALGAYIWIEHREHERDRRIAETRESVWARRLAE